MRQKYDNDYTWLLENMQKHIGDNNSKTDGINMDSDVIVSEYRLLFLKYREQIELYKNAIADLSLR